MSVSVSSLRLSINRIEMRSLLSIVIVIRCVIMTANAAPRIADSALESDIESSEVRDYDYNERLRAMDEADLDFVINRAKYFETEYLEILATNITDTRVDSTLSTFITLLMLVQGAKGSTKTKLMDGLGFTDRELPKILRGIQQLIPWLERHYRVAIYVINVIGVCDANISRSIDQTFIIEIKQFFFMDQVIDETGSAQSHVSLRSRVQFSGLWDNFVFTPTWKRLFYVNNNERALTEYMYRSGEVRVGRVHNLNSTFLQFFFKSDGEADGISMFIFWSDNENDYTKLINHRNKINIRQLIRNNSIKNATVFVPKFEITTENSHNSWISRFFVSGNPFEPDMDLSGISDSLPLIFNEFQDLITIHFGERFSNSMATAGAYLKRRQARSPGNEQNEYVVNHPFTGMIVTTGRKIINLFTFAVSGSTFKRTISSCLISKK